MNKKLGQFVGGLFMSVFLSSAPVRASTVNVVWNTTTDVPVTSAAYVATGNSISFTLNCVPTSNFLPVVKNTGAAFIQGAFGNLAQGQVVALTYSGVTYNIVANYHGGSGNDLVLVWATPQSHAWGANFYGQLGNNSQSRSNTPVAVNTTAGTSALNGKIVISQATGTSHSLALCADGTLAAWGYNYDGELGSNSSAASSVPVTVSTAAGVSSLSGKSVVAISAGIEAIAKYNLTIKDSSDNFRAFYNRALAKKAIGDINGSADDFKQAFEQDSNLPLPNEANQLLS